MSKIDHLESRILQLEKKIKQYQARLSKLEQTESAHTFRTFLQRNGVTQDNLHLLHYAALDLNMAEADKKKVHDLIRPYIKNPVESKAVATRINRQVNKIFQHYDTHLKNLLRL